MNRFFKTLVLSCAVSAIGLVAGYEAPAAYAASTEVKVQVNDSLIQFPDAQPFIDTANTLQIPLRLLVENLGYGIEWSKEADIVKVTLANEERTIVLQTGDNHAVVDGKQVTMDAPAQFSQGRVYLPLRFVSETFGYRVQWDSNNRIAIINEDGQYHAPAWYKPKPAPPVVQSAYQYLGTPYVYGGQSTKGFDCSGFVRYVYQLHGISLPRTSVDMYDYAGQDVTNLQEGDLVFFAEKNKTSHVGIYLGNGQFISAASSSGVSVASITTGYWGKRYVGAKRVTTVS
ncbi:peptidoglycan endopeptidase LytE [Paenibacillus sp. UNCCL117]|uniref:C40 family peptidase n=1 Tax=unclassified Paenibacillus TaxID=185978 RepID=UPI0008842D2B|nr:MULTISPECIES: NlpC/P60 family protein [unclassified Paenibacillus]SDC63067.1 peptidoglycan endopeptidase LytE [Paenibacillus sp. cl123]SFW22198.1 peptidoglycan endopeptidase LytE [Paenibacillus sp. UNCCL117]